MEEQIYDNHWGILTYNTLNIGDEIQSVAASRFLPFVDEYVYREQINRYIPVEKDLKKTKLIMNAFWMHHPENFLPPPYIDPLLISMHVDSWVFKNSMLEETKQYLIKHGPVGCRDKSTMEYLISMGIPAYFSGCLTLTLQRNKDIPKQEYILCVDCEKDVVEKIKTLTKKPVYSISVRFPPIYDYKQRFEIAKLQLRMYHDAHVVVSSRLHVTLPCLAFETPVLNIYKSTIKNKRRYTGYDGFYHSLSIEGNVEDLEKYNFDNPPENPKLYLSLREELIKRCKDFTKFDKNESLIENDPYPFISFASLTSGLMKKKIKKVCFFCEEEDLTTVLNQIKKGKDKELYLNKDKIMTYYDMDVESIKRTIARCRFLSKFIKGEKRKHYIKKIEKLEHQLFYNEM